ncbi:glycosyl hydrolase family 5 [Roseomonas eburnea]|uniref:cellulase n=1 Tax=Neoroseomonas eburnea TaxID=1346889 RepID=A0A9X9XK52_9PROT|nr:glycosyl hydrolase family 8 [Neoroseomonas eburnea]MBR0684088.1 glycosyl hydrolase family 5 [Neoroseomonas eburnea]
MTAAGASGDACRRHRAARAADALLCRRSLVAGACLLHPGAAARAEMASDWAAYRARFVAPEGRVVDTGNDNVSHSEGQGWGLMLAAGFDDRPTFDRLLAWTRRILKRPQDNLHAWRFRPNAVPAVDDPNNATDGDLYIAWGLLMAHARWRHAPYRAEALAIALDVLRLAQRHLHGQAVLLPGVAGFESAQGTVLNPSYVVLPAYAALHRAAPGAGWDRLARDGLALLRRARFGAWALSPDWVMQPVRANAPLGLPERWPPRFSFDAVRVPLLLAWAGETRHPALLGAHAFWSDPRWQDPPAWVDLVTGRTADYAVSPGVRAIAAFVAARIAGPGATVPLPTVNESQDYYSASLTLLVRLACDTTGTRIAA